MSFFNNTLNAFASEIIVGLIVFVASVVFTKIWDRFIANRGRVSQLEAKIASLETANQTIQKRITAANKAVEGNGVWISKPPELPKGYEKLSNGIPIITIANLKGGVGKTTTTANLAWYFAEQGKRVLCIDLDFQGSLSSLAATPDNADASRVSQFVEGRRFGGEIVGNAWPFREAGIENGFILTAGYSFAQVENRVLVHWLTGKETRDIRYFLAETLISDEVQLGKSGVPGFDLVLIDAAPRLTTGTIQALCASTHLLIPTILDKISADAVRYFLDQYFTHREIWPQLKLLGVLGTMTSYDIGKNSDHRELKDLIKEHEEQALRKMEVQCLQLWESHKKAPPADLFFPPNTFIPEKVGFGKAAERGIAALNAENHERADIRAVFERLGQEVARRVNMQI